MTSFIIWGYFKKADVNHTHDLGDMINTLSIGASTPEDADYFISQYVGGGTQTVTYHRRPLSALWSYIKKKADSVYEPKLQYTKKTLVATKDGISLYYSKSGKNVEVNVIGSFSKQETIKPDSGLVLGTLPSTARPPMILFYPLNYLYLESDRSLTLSINSNGQVQITTTSGDSATISSGRYCNGSAQFIQ